MNRRRPGTADQEARGGGHARSRSGFVLITTIGVHVLDYLQTKTEYYLYSDKYGIFEFHFNVFWQN